MDEELRRELLEMARRDERVRAQLVARGEFVSGGYHPRMAAVHEANGRRLGEVIEVGWIR